MGDGSGDVIALQAIPGRHLWGNLEKELLEIPVGACFRTSVFLQLLSGSVLDDGEQWQSKTRMGLQQQTSKPATALQE